jgi:hypothetical protein
VEQERLTEFLVWKVETFDQNSANAAILRKFASEAPALFLEFGLDMLAKGSDTAGYRYLAVQLAEMPQIFATICDPWKYSLEQAVSIAARLLKEQPAFDTKLARLPARQGLVSADTPQACAAERALEIIDQISVGNRVVPILKHLTEHPDPRISAKAALLLGKRVNNEAWARRIVTEGADPRLRANALESAWGSTAPAHIELFQECLGDKDNRVVGNAIVGLHLAGNPDVQQIVQKFAGYFAPEFRMTAAWAMGKLGDSFFAPILTPLIKDGHAGVRRAALRALHRIRQIEKRLEEARAEAATTQNADAQNRSAQADGQAALEGEEPADERVDFRLDASHVAAARPETTLQALR